MGRPLAWLLVVQALFLPMVSASPATALEAPPGWTFEPVLEAQVEDPDLGYDVGPVSFEDGVFVLSTSRHHSSGLIEEPEFTAHALTRSVTAAEALAGSLTLGAEGRSRVEQDEGVAVWLVSPHLGPEHPQDERDTEIYLRRFDRPETEQLTDDGYFDDLPVLDGHRLVWTRYARGQPPEVAMYDLAADKLEVLVADRRGAVQAPDIDGDHVVWQLWNGQYHYVFLQDLASGRTEQIAGAIPGPAGSPLPQLDDGRVAWVESWGEESRIVVLDFSTRKRTVVPAPHLGRSGAVDVFGRSPTLDGDLLLWRSSAGIVDNAPREMLMLHDLSTGATRTLASVDTHMISFDVDNGMVVWQESGFVGTPDFRDRSINVFDSATGEITEIARGPALGMPAIDRGRVVFAEGAYPLARENTESTVWLAISAGAEDYPRYLDVDFDHRYYDAITALTESGVVSGIRSDAFATFRPAYPLYRAQFAKMLVGAFLDPRDGEISESAWPTDEAAFGDLGSDNPADLYPHDYIGAAARLGLMRGKSATVFDPWGRVTRAQVVTTAVRAVESRMAMSIPFPGWERTTLGNFSLDHAMNMFVAEIYGLLEGVEGFSPAWDPWAPASRAETAQILANMRDLLKEGR